MEFKTDKLKGHFSSFLETKIVPLEAKYKVIIWVAAMLLPMAAFLFFYYFPKNDQIAGLEKSKVKLEREIAEAKARANELDKHKAEMAETELLFQQASVLLPQKKEIPSLLTNISGLGTGSGLDFISFQPKGEVAREFYAEIPVDISVRGPYHNMGNFLYQVSKLDRIVSVSNISLGSPTIEKGEMLLTGRFTLVTYRFTEAGDTAATKQAGDNVKKNKR
jgi:type IV pilus assembly protein PilO